MLWGRPNLGAKKAREKRGENSPLLPAHLNSIIDGQKQKYCPCPNKRQRSAAMVIRWSTFAESWNKWVDTLGHSKPTVTYKSASHLQDAYKSMKRRAVRQATLRPHTQTIRELRSSHTNREAAVAYLPEFAQPEPPTVAQPFVDATDTVDQDQAPNYDGDSDEPERAAAHQPRRRKNSGKRCRKCGKEYAHKDWKEFHVVTQAPTSGNLRSNDIKIDEHCTVPIDQYEPGFQENEGN